MASLSVADAEVLRFGFGENWRDLLPLLDQKRVDAAVESLVEMLGHSDLHGRRFLDIGCGSGLFSLAALRLGATVHSFDYDPQSVECARRLKVASGGDDRSWTIERASVLDEGYMATLRGFDIVYSWGVLHHTGEMWRALELAQRPLRRGGQLFVAIYNDTGTQSVRWRHLKKTYNRLPRPLRKPFAATLAVPFIAKAVLRSVARLGLDDELRAWTTRSVSRGMHPWHDMIDWVGGYPYEVARADQIFDFYRRLGYTLQRLRSTSGLGCNEFVFTRDSASSRL
jgi:2-polyprenyl-6-hydroxyphenyl methylase/3-demethylubiquinone-9 3-methyltransferase